MPGFKQQKGASRPLMIGGLVLLAVLVLGGVFLGPALLGYYRFSQAVDTASQHNEAIAGPWPQLNGACVTCHGFSGNTVTQLYPRLAGQPAAYLSGQLNAFASGQRSNPIMSSLAINLSPAEIEQLSTYFAAQPAEPNSAFKADPQQRALGEQLAKAGNCVACHGAELQGQAMFPRLAGQGYDYLVKQLNDFKSGKRTDATGSMAPVVAALSEQDISHLATYLASHQRAENEQ